MNESIPDNMTASSLLAVKNHRALAYLVIVLAGLMVGQWMLRQAVNAPLKDTPPWQPFVLLSIAAGTLWRGLRHIEESNLSVEQADPPVVGLIMPGFTWPPMIAEHRRIILLLVSGLFIAYILYRIPQLSSTDSYTGVSLVWIAAFGSYVLANMPPIDRPLGDITTLRIWWRTHYRLVLLVGGVVLLAFVLRAWRIATVPFTLGGDEGSQGLEAVKVIEGEIRNPFATGWLGVPTMSFFFNSITIRLLGQTMLALRLPWAFVGTAAVLATFLLIRQLKGTRLAVVTTILVATYHYHIHFSRLGSNQIADSLFMPLALFFLVRALDRQKSLDWLLTGAVSGLAFYFYAGARLTPVVVLAILGYTFIREPRRFWQTHQTGLLVALGAFLVVGAPIFQYAIRFPDEFNARLNQVGIIQSGWLEREVGIRGQSKVHILLDQFRRAVLAFNYYPDRTVWYGLRQPLLDPFFGSLFLVGLGYGLLRLWGRNADARLAPLVAWWWGGVILGGVMTESPPSSQRLITLAIPTCFFVALALWEMLRLAQQALRGVPVDLLLALSVLLFGLISLVTYFLDYIPQRLYGGGNAELATEIVPILNDLPPGYRIYFVGSPWMYWGFATLPYLVQDANARDIEAPITSSLLADLIPPGEGAMFIFLPPRLAELEPVQQHFPQGERRDIFSPVDKRLMGTLYRVPAHGTSRIP